MKNFKTKLFGASLFLLAFASSCKHDYGKIVPPSPVDPGGNGSITAKTPKVLYIIADGARGVSVRDANIPNLSSLIPHAIYSWNSLADTINTDASNWADMITGVKKEKHNVLTENFANNALATYPPIYDRIKSVRPTFRSAVFATSSAFKNNLTDTSVAVRELLSSDDALTTRMTNFLQTDDAQLVVGEFGAIEAAGKTSGFDDSYPAYKAAIEKFDTQVGTILSALKARPTYAKESWMIVVTSNKGGMFTLPPAQNDKTIFSNTNINTFTIMAADTYNQTFLAKPFLGNSYTGNSIRFLGDPQKGTGQVSPQLSPFFNFGDTSGFTISVKIKKHKNPVNTSRGDYYYQWPGFMGKRGASISDPTPQTGWGGSGNPGWDFCLFQNGWRFFISGKGSFANGREIGGLNFTGDSWHDLTAVVERKPDGSKVVRVYTDGVMGIGNNGGGAIPAVLTTYQTTPITLATTGTDVNVDNNSVLRVGYTPGEIDGDTQTGFGKIDVELKELKIFKAAIPDAIVTEYACDQKIDQSHPYYKYLIGYWPMDEGSGTTLADKGPLGANLNLNQAQTNGYQWQSFSDLICSPVASNLALLVPKNSDIPTQILSWLNVPRQTSWSLDGKVWITN
ncbi:DUF4983 domain-containing protein [Mucilaginibacter ximonensis]|uniref:DUF4983 domain-containing protein n=1 Tax=Mucilaginibacter ximonensis TaxID=538021 RepID=A0ABW5YB51_9SPHI